MKQHLSPVMAEQKMCGVIWPCRKRRQWDKIKRIYMDDTDVDRREPSRY